MPDELYNFAAEGPLKIIQLKLPVHLDVIAFDDLNTKITDRISKEPGDYIIDLSGTEYVGSAVLGLLVNLRSRIRRAGGKLVLCCLSPRILEIFRVGSLESLFTISPTRAAAVEVLKK